SSEGDSAQTKSAESSDTKQYCSFADSGANFSTHPQPCYTCTKCMAVTDVCCEVCAKQCHAGHEVKKLDPQQMFCDCGAKPGLCKSMPAAKSVPKSVLTSGATTSTFMFWNRVVFA